LLGETKRKPLPEVSADKKELVEKILNLRIVKEDFTRFKRERVNAENESFEAYEQLLALCDGDVDLLKRLLGERHPHRVKETDVLEP
jgi:succinate dehydrogenase flavin-adding protein (antitoxin of CptAB toxin-antitoxin module)